MLERCQAVLSFMNVPEFSSAEALLSLSRLIHVLQNRKQPDATFCLADDNALAAGKEPLFA